MQRSQSAPSPFEQIQISYFVSTPEGDLTLKHIALQIPLNLGPFAMAACCKGWVENFARLVDTPTSAQELLDKAEQDLGKLKLLFENAKQQVQHNLKAAKAVQNVREEELTPEEQADAQKEIDKATGLRAVPEQAQE